MPFLTVLAPSERYARKNRQRHKKLTDWGRQMLLQAARWLPDRRIVGVTDSSFAAIELLNDVRRRVCMITRLRLDARLFDPPPRRRRGAMGRPRVVGKRQPTLAKRLADSKTRWRRYRVTGWYGRSERLVEIVSNTAVWYHPGRLVPIRYVLVRDVASELKPQAFLCTDLDARPARYPALVRPPMVDRSYLRRGPPPPRRRNPTPMVRPSYCAYHACTARTVLIDYSQGP